MVIAPGPAMAWAALASRFRKTWSMDERMHSTRGSVPELPVHGDPILEEVVEQGEARLELLVQVHRLPHVVLAAREHAQVAHDLPGALRALADALGHRVEVPERVVDLAALPLRLRPDSLGLRRAA